MFKFFRKYNKYLLATGGSLLMLVFLLQMLPSGAMPWMRSGSQGEMPIGTIGKQKLTQSDLYGARAQLTTLGELHPRLLEVAAFPMGAAHEDAQAERWLLLVHEAQQMGLYAGEQEITEVLALIPMRDDPTLAPASETATEREERLKQMKQERDASPAIRQAVRRWLMILQHQELVLGMTHVPVAQRLNNMEGGVRMSDSFLRSFMDESYATVAVEALPIDANRYLAQVMMPSPGLEKTLFDQNRDKLPGRGRPYGFGYRSPNRVKIEWIEIPVRLLRDSPKAQPTEDKLLRHYRSSPRFQAIAATRPATQPGAALTKQDLEYRQYLQVRELVRQDLLDQTAQALAEEMKKEILRVLWEQAGRLPDADGYKTLPAATQPGDKTWEPIPLRTVAQNLAADKRFAVAPPVHRLDGEWHDRQSLGKLAGMGQSFLAASADAPMQTRFADYAMSLRELKPGPDNVLAVEHRLQVGLPSKPLKGLDGTSYIFRVFDAAPAYTPQSPAEVATQLAADAKRVQAYEILISDRVAGDWLARARKEPLDAVGKEINANVIMPKPFPRRTPSVDDVGASPEFIQVVYKRVDQLTVKWGVTQTAWSARVPLSERTLVVAVPSKLSLYLVEIRDFKPLTPSAYFIRLAMQDRYQPMIAVLLSGMTEWPLETDSISKRIGYQPYGGSRRGSRQQPTTAPADDAEPADDGPGPGPVRLTPQGMP